MGIANDVTKIAQMYATLRLCPSVLDKMVWRLSKVRAIAIAAHFGCEISIESATAESNLTMLGLPVELIDSDEILLVVKVA